MTSYSECPCGARYDARAGGGQGLIFEFDVPVPEKCLRCGIASSEFKSMYGPCAMERLGDWPLSDLQQRRFRVWRAGEEMPDE